MKKLVSVFLALTMLFTLCATAVAADTDITITEERTYVGYMLLGLTIGLKTGEHHPTTCDNVNHDENCYNYAYTINDKYITLLKNEVFANAGTNFWGAAGLPASANNVTETQIMDYLESQTSDVGDVYGTLRTAADRIYRAIRKANLGTDATINGNEGTIADGYWLIADVTDLDGDKDANSLVMLTTKGQGDRKSVV